MTARTWTRREATAAAFGWGALWLGVGRAWGEEEVIMQPVLPEQPVAPPTWVELCGDWNCGSWKSGCTGHTGKLKARIAKAGCDRYTCTFSGTFLKLVPFRYTVELIVTGRGDGTVSFKANRNLPLFGGEFSCCGTATPCRFRADYRAPNDRGTFEMSR